MARAKALGRGWGAPSLLMLIVGLGGCRTSYLAPPPEAPPAGLARTPRGGADPGDLEGIEAEESLCRRSLDAQTVAASLRAIDAATERLGGVCSIEPVGDDPLLWRVWCRSDALFRSGHYLRSSEEPFACGDEQAASAFECAGKILSRLLLEPGHASQVELVSVGHVDRQRISSEGEFVREPCTELQSLFEARGAEPWTAPEEPPEDVEVWNQRLAWCRAAFGASETLRGLRANASAQQIQIAVVGAGTRWLDARGECPHRDRGQRPGACPEARRLDVLMRFVPAVRSVERSCRAPTELRGGRAARALYCYEDCSVTRDMGRVRQQYSTGRRSGFVLFERSAAEPGAGWIIRRPGPANAPNVNLGAVEAILEMREQPPEAEALEGRDAE